jgi:hypothetical protein
VPAMASRKIDTLRGRVVLSIVNELIDRLTGTWDEAQLREIFNPLEVQHILQIPLSPNMEDDFVAWNCTKNYQFSVWSAYYLEWNHQYGGTLRQADGQGTMSKNPVWEIVWKLKVPAKIKILSWHALHGLIPGVGVLANRHIMVSPECPICKQGSKDIMHLSTYIMPNSFGHRWEPPRHGCTVDAHLQCHLQYPCYSSTYNLLKCNLDIEMVLKVCYQSDAKLSIIFLSLIQYTR